MPFTQRFPATALEYEPADNARSSLAASISNSTLSFSGSDDAAADAFANFPEGNANNEAPFPVTTESEIILCFSRTGDTFIVYDEDTHLLGYLSAGQDGRGYAGTTPAAHNIPSGGSIVFFEYVTAIQIKEVNDAIALLETNKAEDSEVVHDTGDESIGGLKEFEDDKARSTTNAAPTNDLSFTNKKYVDDQTAVVGDMTKAVYDTGDNAIVDNAERVTVKLFTYGETIAVGEPLYLKTSDSKVYLTTTAGAESTFSFIGFAIDSGEADDTNKKVQTGGPVTILSGLTPGSDYYLSGSGAIATSPNTTYSYKIGLAISATQLLIVTGGKSFNGVDSVAPFPTTGTVSNTITCGFRPKLVRATGFVESTAAEFAVGWGSYDLDGNKGLYCRDLSNIQARNNWETSSSHIVIDDVVWNSIKIGNVTSTGFDIEYQNTNAARVAVSGLTEYSVIGF